MSNLGEAVLALISKFGVMATITWKSRALDVASNASVPMILPVYIDTETISVGGGGVTTILKAFLPNTEQSLEGATLTIGGKRYTLNSVTVQHGIGGAALYQEAQLV